MASLKKRGKYYHIRFKISFGDKEQQISRSLKTANKEIAQQRMKLLEARAEYCDPFSPEFDWDVENKTKEWWTVRECIEEFVEAKSIYRPATVRGYKYVLDKWMRYSNIQNKLINKVRKPHIELFLMRDGIKAITRHSERRRLRAFWSWCMNKKRVKINLLEDIDLPQKDVEYRPKMLTEEELERIFAAFDADLAVRQKRRNYRGDESWFKPAMALYFYAGMRLSEVCKNNADPKSGLKGEAIIGSQGRRIIDFIYLSKAKKNRERFIPVGQKLQAYLLDYFDVRGWPGADEYIITNGRKQAVVTRTMQHKFKAYARLAGVPETRTIHGMRHQRGTTWLEMGFTLSEVKDMLGHYSVEVTDQFYSHLTPNKLKEKMKKLEKG